MTQPSRIWKKGERVTIGYVGRRVTGRVELASANGVSLMLAFEALLAGYAGHMPVLWNEKEGGYRCLILGAVVELTEPEVPGDRLHV